MHYSVWHRHPVNYHVYESKSDKWTYTGTPTGQQADGHAGVQITPLVRPAIRLGYTPRNITSENRESRGKSTDDIKTKKESRHPNNHSR